MTLHWRVGKVFPRAYYAGGFVILATMTLPLMLEILLKLPGNSSGIGLINAVLLWVLAILPAGVMPVLVCAAVPVGILSWSARRLFAGVEPQPYQTIWRT